MLRTKTLSNEIKSKHRKSGSVGFIKFECLQLSSENKTVGVQIDQELQVDYWDHIKTGPADPYQMIVKSEEL